VDKGGLETRFRDGTCPNERELSSHSTSSHLSGFPCEIKYR